jgi:DNA-directed RNA polymerase subunit omega
MARITVEDCLEKIGDDNRFSLVHLAVERVKQRRQGAPLLIPTRKNKEVVMALREIAAGAVTFANILDLPKFEGETAAVAAAEHDDPDKQTAREAA